MWKIEFLFMIQIYVVSKLEERASLAFSHMFIPYDWHFNFPSYNVLYKPVSLQSYNYNVNKITMKSIT